MTTRDDLGDRMKHSYENRTRYLLPRRSYTLIRVDGKSFHTYTRHCARPCDLDLMADMDQTAMAMCREIEGAKLAFVQSDEISLLLTDFATIHTGAWFDGCLQKMCSLSAAIATAHFNRLRSIRNPGALEQTPACFDSRVFQIPDPTEVYNYFLWRQQDAARNSIQMTARAYFSHAELDGVTCNQAQEKLMTEKSVNWNDMPAGFKRGRCITYERTLQQVEYHDKRTGDLKTAEGVQRGVWSSVVPPIFSQQPEWLMSRIPLYS